jgi:hypothetical protein
MQLTVWKYTLAVTSTKQTLSFPQNAQILEVATQNHAICLWVLVDRHTQSLENRVFEVFGTGHDIPEGIRQHIGTVQMLGGALIWHVFENLE